MIEADLEAGIQHVGIILLKRLKCVSDRLLNPLYILPAPCRVVRRFRRGRAISNQKRAKVKLLLIGNPVKEFPLFIFIAKGNKVLASKLIRSDLAIGQHHAGSVDVTFV